MKPFFATKDFQIRSIYGYEGDGAPIEFVFLHAKTNENGMFFNVGQAVKDTPGVLAFLEVFRFPGKSATQQRVCDHYARTRA